MEGCNEKSKCNIKLDEYTFNDLFDDTKTLQKEINKINDESRLTLLSEQANQEFTSKPIYKYNFDDYKNGLQESMFGLLNDTINMPITSETFTKNNRLFFFGVCIVLLFVVIYIINLMF